MLENDDHILPRVRRDLELIPVQHAGKPFIVVRDPLGFVEQGKALPLSLYQFMVELERAKDIRDLQTVLMRQQGGLLVGLREVREILSRLDEQFLLDSDRYRKERDKAVAEFSGLGVRPSSHFGPPSTENAEKLKGQLEEIMGSRPSLPAPAGKVVALVSPHIDLSVGKRVYASAYHALRETSPSRIILLGVGHQAMEGLFCLTDKDFETPLGMVKNDQEVVTRLREAGRSCTSSNDFAHKSEHSIEFQVVFLQALLGTTSFRIVPILCGSLVGCLPEYSRRAYTEKAGAFLASLSETLLEDMEDTLAIAGVDLSHIGPKFGHERSASVLEGQSKAHDQRLLEALCKRDADTYWKESIRVSDQFNVCGFSALAALLEILPPVSGEILDYQIWHEQATQSAVSFAAVAFSTLAP